MDISKINESITTINQIEFDQIWSGTYYTNQRDSFNDAMTQLNKCVEEINNFNNALAKLEKYIEICDRIQELYGSISTCSSGHTEKQKDNGCVKCGGYTLEILQKEIQRKTLREEIIAILRKFTGIDIEISSPTDYNPVNVDQPKESDLPFDVTRYEPTLITNPNYDGSVLSPSQGRNDNGPQGCETWYDLDMDFVVERMDTVYGKPIETWIDPETGIKMCTPVGGDGTAYVMVAADAESVWGNGNDVNPVSTYHMGDIVQTSWGPGMVVDYCGLAVEKRKAGKENHFDIAVAWQSGYISAGQQAADERNGKNNKE